MSDSPAAAEERQLRDIHIQVKLPADVYKRQPPATFPFSGFPRLPACRPSPKRTGTNSNPNGPLSLIHILEISDAADRLVQRFLHHFGVGFATLQPVSYTHLDVYKRQGYTGAAE